MATYKAVLGSTFGKKPKKDGTYSIIIRITEKRKHKYFTISYSVKEKDWNPSPREGENRIKAYVRKSHPSHKKINHYIHNEIEKMRDKVNNEPVKSPSRIKAAIRGDTDEKSFLHFYRKRLESFRADPATYRKWKRYNSVYNNLTAFLKGKDLLFDELNYDLVDRYRSFRISQGVDVTTDFKKLSAILNEASRRELFDRRNVFIYQARNAPKKKKLKEALTDEELNRIKTLELPVKSLIWHVRNFFMLNFYFHGIRVGDSLLLKQRQIQDGRVYYDMGKNGKFASFKIPHEAYQFLKHYLNNKLDHDAFVFPFLSDEIDYSDEVFLKKQLEAKTALINKYLKKIANKTEINKNLTTHVARHTFASIARNKIEDISKIQKFLRHSSLRETQIYLGELTDKSLDESTDEIFG